MCLSQLLAWSVPSFPGVLWKPVERYSRLCNLLITVRTENRLEITSCLEGLPVTIPTFNIIRIDRPRKQMWQTAGISYLWLSPSWVCHPSRWVCLLPAMSLPSFPRPPILDNKPGSQTVFPSIYCIPLLSASCLHKNGGATVQLIHFEVQC